MTWMFGENMGAEREREEGVFSFYIPKISGGFFLSFIHFIYFTLCFFLYVTLPVKLYRIEQNLIERWGGGREEGGGGST